MCPDSLLTAVTAPGPVNRAHSANELAEEAHHPSTKEAMGLVGHLLGEWLERWPIALSEQGAADDGPGGSAPQLQGAA